MFRWFLGAALAFAPLPAYASQTFDYSFQFSRNGDEIYVGSGTLTGDAATANPDGSTSYTLTDADGTITPNFASDPTFYTVLGIADFFGRAENTLTQSGSGVTFGSFGLFLDSGPGILTFKSADASVSGIEGAFSLDGITIAPEDVAAAVPEPATWALMILGFGAVGSALRRRQKTTAAISLA